MSERPLIVTCGDPAGVGPQVAVQALAESTLRAVVLGDAEWLRNAFADRGVSAAMSNVERGTLDGRNRIGLVHLGTWDEATIEARAPSAEGGRAQLEALETASDMMNRGLGSALVTGPASKEAISALGTMFSGQTEFLAQACGLEKDAVSMLFLGPRLKVGLATTHLSVRDAAAALTPARVSRTIRHLHEALQRLGQHGPIAVTGVNPHAGEGGLFGDEEGLSIQPAVEALGSEIIREIKGPMPAEAAFRYAADGTLAGVVAMLHDQATIASKLLDWGRAVNVTWGLPYVRASVDHGVAYDAAAAGRADPQGMSAAVAAARVLGPAETFAENF